MTNVSLKCQCGKVQGIASNITPTSGNRVICCCSDCQAFAAYLKQGSNMLDQFGGTDILQMSQSQLRIEQGQQYLQSMRLTKNGLLRWYTSCCHTAVGNTVSAKLPFVGVIHSFIDEEDRDGVLGPVRAAIQTQYAIGNPNYPRQSPKYPVGVTARLMSKILIWKIQGKHKPTVFFGDDGRPAVKPIIASDTTDQSGT